jgi:uncharacterized protein (TIRG00374 family)
MNHSRTRKFRAVLGILIGAIFIYLVMRDIDFARVGTLFTKAKLFPLTVAIFAFVADFLLRAVRFWTMLRLTTGRKLPLVPTIGPFIASFGISDILPFRVGDALRVLWFSRQFRISAGTVVGTMIVERILDLVSIVFLGAGALALLDTATPSVLVWNFEVVLLIAVGGGAVILLAPAMLCRILEKIFGKFANAAIDRLVELLRATSTAVVQIGSWRSIILFIIISITLWILESVVMLGAWVSLGGELSAVQKPFLAFAFSTLGTLVPSLPGHFGSFEFFGLQAFALAGVETSFAAAVLLLTHLILWAPTALFGIIWLTIGHTTSERLYDEADTSHGIDI